ncbi:SusC/RagA family TonB-linked outer membrane protein [Larkinella rosea]|uniref:TonB-dependent receptor n=1 Tax=Larkinella rosea TaxID=2025312 RepID=A0A3P1C1F0_9BACT|nr:TonB-dependent receptor [Larkinella rosea]RRB07250.1 TonB-dependent receptor [Larkinella rosea]
MHYSTFKKSVWLLVGLTTLTGRSGFSQELASIKELTITSTIQDKRKTTQLLTRLLSQLGSHYGVSINYDSDLLEGKTVKTAPLDLKTRQEAELEETLTSLLSSQGLRFEKLKSGFYLIHSEKENRKLPEPKTGRSDNRRLLETSIQEAIAFQVSGKVSDETGQGLPGTSVVLKGTTNGTVTDASGNYSLSVPDENSILVFSYIGYVAQEVAITGRSTVAVTLKKDVKSLSEIVVVGYGTQSKTQVIGSISQINADKINNRTVTQLSQGLTGQMPGVTIIQRSGQPGSSGGTIQIRGVGSFSASTAPLILIDGIPANSFNNVDPNDVESVSVLKDASSAAIYGARAANGVILVTTKTGKSGKMRISYNGYGGVQKMTATPRFVTSAEYAQLLNEAVPNSYTEDQIQKFRTGSDPDNYPNSDFMKGTFKKQASQTSHNFSVSNGTENTQYLLSFGYLGQNGILDKNNFNRYNLRLNLTNKLSQKVKLTTRLSGIQSVDNQPAPPATLDFIGMDGIISNTVRIPSIYPIRYANGDWGTGVSNKGTSVSYLQNDSFYKGKTTDLGANARLDYTVIPDLTLSALGGYTQLNQRVTRFLASQRLNSTITLGPSSLNETSTNTNYRTIQAFADYKTNIGLHEFGVLAGYSFETSLSESLAQGRGGLPSNTITVINAGDASSQTTSGSASEWALESYFGRAQYNYDRKYLVEGAVRYDGSSRFPTNRKYALFPSVAVGWRISEEGFVKDHLPWVDELKVRASHGRLGNQNILTNGDPNYYPYQNVLNTGYNYPFGGVITTGVARTTITDTTLHWESTRTTDIGIEGSLFKRLLAFSITHFNKYTYDILVSPASSVAQVLGFTVGQKNSGRLSNKGWEFTLDHRHKFGDVGYSVGFNLTYTKNTILDLGVGNVKQPNGLVGNGSDLFIGYPLQLYYGYVADGLFTNQDDINSWANQTAIAPNPKPGDIRYKDISGPDGKPDGKVDANYDRTLLGSQIPKFTYGINLGATYKGFDLGILFQGVRGVSGYLNNYVGWALYNQGTIQRWQMDERWTPANPDRNAGYPRMEVITNAGTNNTLSSSFWILNGSYLRLKNIQLGYTIPATLTRKLKLSTVRVYANGENLKLWSNYREGWDPEINTGGSYYPILANYTFGLNLTF